MNLEEELSMISDVVTTGVTGTVTTQTNEPTIITAEIGPATMVNDQTIQAAAQVVQPSQTIGVPYQPVQPAPQVQPVQLTQPVQPAMVNPTVAQKEVNNFNFTNMSVGVNERTSNTNPLSRLSGQLNETFRLHLLPGVEHQGVRVHYDVEKGHNFCCLAQAYGTGTTDKCCLTHGTAKQRYIIPVIVIPSDNRGQVQQGVQLRGELKVLVVSEKMRNDLIDQAQMSGTSIDVADVVATVRDAKFKTFNFAINPNSVINQVVNVADLQNEWKANATIENIIGVVGRLITREQYEDGYSNYDFHKYLKSNDGQQTAYQQQSSQYQQQYAPQQNIQYGNNPYPQYAPQNGAQY